MRELSDLVYEVDEIRQDVRDLDGSQDTLERRVERIEDMLLHLAKHQSASPTAAGAFVVDVLTSPL